MKKLDVPLYLQDLKSVDCGPVCIQMILDFYGIKSDLKDLRKKLKYAEMGTSVYDNGSLVLDEGLKAVAITAQPFLFAPDITAKIKSNKDILKIVNEKSKKMPKFKSTLGTLKKFLRKGGKLKIDIPTFEHIRIAIDNNNPVLALFYGQALGSNEGLSHFVVVTGYDKNRVFINNPAPNSKRQAWFPVDQFLYGVHASTMADIDNGTLLIVSKN